MVVAVITAAFEVVVGADTDTGEIPLMTRTVELAGVLELELAGRGLLL